MQRRQKMCVGLLAANVFGLFALTGCGSKTYPVQGQIVFADGAPAKELAGYTIMFQSADQKTGADGIIQADGSFTLGTFQPGDGAVPGKQRIAITPPVPDIHKPPAPPLIAALYGRFETSPLEVTIPAENNRVMLTVERKKN